MQVLLIQLREDAATRDHEFDCFVKQAGIDPSVVVRINALEHDVTPNDLHGVHVIVVGGSGEFLISRGDIAETIDAVGETLRAARKQGIPMLGMCFGAQIMAHVFGGTVALDAEKQEIGTFMVTKNVCAADCPIFSLMPETFPAQLGHKDFVTVLPPGAVNLASSDLSTVQAFTFPGEPIYATTFHPELDENSLLWRIDQYAMQYDLSQQDVATMKQALYPTPDSVKVLHHFFEEVVKNGKRFRA